MSNKTSYTNTFAQHALQGKEHFQNYIETPSNINLGHIKPILEIVMTFDFKEKVSTIII